MKYSISQERLIKLVDSIIKQDSPKFNNRDASVGTSSDGDDTFIEYYIMRGHISYAFARYHLWKNELELRPDLYDKLEGLLGWELMTGVLDWFNKEFDQEAENLRY
jgi:hypothetical protein